MKCENTSLAGALCKYVCTKTVEGVNVSCTNISGTYFANGKAFENALTRYSQNYIGLAQVAYCDNNNGDFDGNEWPMRNGDTQSCPDVSTQKQDALCSAISRANEEGKLSQLRSYAENRQGGGGDEFTSCQRDLRSNKYKKVDQHQKPIHFVLLYSEIIEDWQSAWSCSGQHHRWQ